MSASGVRLQFEAKRSKILFADDHRLVLDAVAHVAGPHYDVASATTAQELEHKLEQFSPDLVVLDTTIGGEDGFAVARRLLARDEGLRIIFLSLHTDAQHVQQALDVGAKGYMSKQISSDDFLVGIRTVLEGGTYVDPHADADGKSPSEKPLTERQKEVLRLISQGCSAKEIASNLSISVRTAEFHRAAIMERLQLHSTALMTRYAVERGMA